MQTTFELLHKMDTPGCKSGKRIPKLKALIKTTPGLTYSGTRRQTKSPKDGLQGVLFKKKGNVWPVFLGHLSKPRVGHRLREQSSGSH